MNKFCSGCGRELSGDPRFCPGCGAAQEVGTTPNPFGAEYSDNTQNPQNGSGVQGGYNPQNNQQGGFFHNQQGVYNQNGFDCYNNIQQSNNNQRNRKKLKFIFVNALVFLIIFSIRCLTSLASLNEWRHNSHMIGQNIMSVVWFSLLMTFICFICTLLLLIFSKSAKNRNNSPESRTAAVSKTFIISILALVAGAIYLLSELALLGQLMDLLDLEDQANTLLGSVAFIVTFIVFMAINIAKAASLKHFLKNKLQSSGNTDNGNSAS